MPFWEDIALKAFLGFALVGYTAVVFLEGGGDKAYRKWREEVHAEEMYWQRRLDARRPIPEDLLVHKYPIPVKSLRGR